MRGLPIVLGASASACACAACAALLGVEGVGYSEGPTSDSGPTDTAMERGAVGDGGAGGDGAPLADASNVDAISPNTSWCSRHPHAFCEDFDQGTLFTASAWALQYVGIDGGIALEDGGGAAGPYLTSPPFAARFTVPAPVGGNTQAVRVYIKHAITSTTAQVACGFDMVVLSEDPSSIATPVTIYLTGSSAYARYGFSWNISQPGGENALVFLTQTPLGSPVFALDTVVPPPVGQWQSYRFALAPAPDGGPQALLSGTLGSSIVTLHEPPFPNDNQGVELSIGLVAAETSTSPWDVVVDNVYCDYP